MIKCTMCHGRIRPPSRPWTTAADGRISFYRTTPDGMALYEKWLARLAKKMAFVHELCAETAEPGTLPEKHVVALNLDIRLRHQQRRKP